MRRRSVALGVILGASVAAGLAACATSGATVDVISQATSSPYFSLSSPSVYGVKDGAILAGRVCRRGRATLLSPPRVRLEHISATDQVMQTAYAYIPSIHRNIDEACTHYSSRVAWQFAPGEKVRACFERGRGCRLPPTTTAVTPVAAPPTP